MKKILMIALMGVALASCGVNKPKAVRALESIGLTNVQITGYSWFGCSKDDTFASNFTATGANGKPVSGSICSGWFGKGFTPRFD